MYWEINLPRIYHVFSKTLSLTRNDGDMMRPHDWMTDEWMNMNDGRINDERRKENV